MPIAANMSCTVEQIAEKKRIALERLQRARQQQQQQAPTSTASALPKPQGTTIHNAAAASSRTAGNSASQFLAVNSFYATSTSKPPATPFAASPSRRPQSQQPQQTNFNGGKMKSSPHSGRQRHQPYGQPSKNVYNKSGGSQQQQLAPVFLPTKTAVCSMISAERFQVQASFHTAMIDVFKSIPSREYGKNNYSLYSPTSRFLIRIVLYAQMRPPNTGPSTLMTISCYAIAWVP